MVFLILLSLYLWCAFNDIIVILKNYNFRRANKCHWTSCGLYYHYESDPETKDCLSPCVSNPSFEKLSRGGTQSGCRHSIQVREVNRSRKPAADYEKEWLEMYNSFHISKTWWRVIAILAGILLLAFGVVNLYNFIKVIF